MLKTTIEALETYDSYTRPAIYDSIRAVLAFYGLTSATNIIYNGENDVTKLIGNSSSDPKDADRYTEGTFRNKIFIKANVERSEFWNLRRERVESPVFCNTELPLIMTPSFEGKEITVEVSARFNTEMAAKQFRNRINRQREAQAVMFNFTPTVHMVVNEGLYDFIKIIHGMLVKNDPTTPEFQEWFDRYKTFNFTPISNVAGNLPQVVVPLRPNAIGINFTELFVRQVTKGNSYAQWHVEFAYSFYFNEFLGWDLEYPLNVYQDQIPEGYIPRPQPGYTQYTGVPAAPEIMANRLTHPPLGYVQSPYYLRLPEHDLWKVPYTYWLQPVIVIRAGLKDEEEQVLGNVFGLEEFQWRPKAIEHIKRRHEVAFKHRETPFLFQVYAGNKLVKPEHLRLDEDGTISLLIRPNLKLTYHVVINIDYAIRDYSQALWDDLGWEEDRWGVLRTIFNWIDFNKFPKPWIHNVETICYNIDLGYGLKRKPFNIYQGAFGILAHNEGR